MTLIEVDLMAEDREVHSHRSSDRDRINSWVDRCDRGADDVHELAAEDGLTVIAFIVYLPRRAMTRPSRVQLLLGSWGLAVVIAVVAGAAINVAAELTSTMVAPNEKSKWSLRYMPPGRTRAPSR